MMKRLASRGLESGRNRVGNIFMWLDIEIVIEYRPATSHAKDEQKLRR